MKRITIYISMILIILFGVGLFFMQDIINYLTKEPVKVQKSDLTKDDLYSEIISDNLSIQLNKKDFLEGFWYEGPDGLVYFDINALLKFGYSMDEIKAMIKKIKKEKMYKKDNIEILSEDELDDDIKFSNVIYDSSPLLKNNYTKIKKSLEGKKPKKSIDYYRLSEIYSFEGDYKKSSKYLDIACKKDKKYCKKNKVVVSGVVVGLDGNSLKDVKVTLLSSNKSTFVDKNGKYHLNLSLVKLKKERLSFEKEGYSTAFISFSNNSDLQKKITGLNVEMAKEDKGFLLNLKTGEIKNGQGEYKNNKFILKTNRSIYYIPKNSFVDENNRKYDGIVKASLFEFNEKNVPQNLLHLDSFSNDKNFLGTSMKTYGMPYIIFTKEKGERLYIRSSNPMILETRIDYLKVLFASERLSKDKKEEIISKSNKNKFYYNIDKIDKEYTQLIPYWVLDQKTGVWANVGFDVVDPIKGLIRTQFYTTK